MAGRGGRIPGAGRKRHVPPLKEYHVGLTEEQARLVRMWGRGDLSAGLRWLVTAAAPMICRRDEIESPTGKVYEFSLHDETNVVETLWTSTCNGSPGSLKASVTQLSQLFLNQIPNGSNIEASLQL